MFLFITVVLRNISTHFGVASLYFEVESTMIFTLTSSDVYLAYEMDILSQYQLIHSCNLLAKFILQFCLAKFFQMFRREHILRVFGHDAHLEEVYVNTASMPSVL